MKCLSTHNGGESFTGAGIQKAIDLNSILGSKTIVMAHPGKEIKTIDGWKEVADTLNAAAAKFKAAGMRAGYHNHDAEWRPIDGQRPIEVLARNTHKDVTLQLDVGTCVAMGADPVAWIKANPGRIRSMHCKDWSPEHKYQVLFGDGKAPWKGIFEAAEKSAASRTTSSSRRATTCLPSKPSPSAWPTSRRSTADRRTTSMPGPVSVSVVFPSVEEP